MARGRGPRKSRPIPGDPHDPQGFPLLVGEFCEWMAVRGYSQRTLENTRRSMRTLAEWLAERSVQRPGEVTKPMLDAYQRALYHRRKRDGRPLSFQMQNHLLIPVRMFFRYLTRTSQILYNPASELELPKVERRLPAAVLSAEEVERVLALADLSTALGLRDRTMMELLYATGVRRAELANLSVFGLDLNRRALSVREGKGKRDRILPTGERAAAWCLRYLDDARGELVLEPDEGTLFLTADGLPFTLSGLTHLMGGYVGQIGKPGACHIFRHSMATAMLEGGADIRHIQEMLGHLHITSTQVYTHISLRTLAAVHAASHPASSNEPRRLRDGGRHGAILRPASALVPGAQAGGGQDPAEALQRILAAEDQDEQHDLHGRHPRGQANP